MKGTHALIKRDLAIRTNSDIERTCSRDMQTDPERTFNGKERIHKGDVYSYIEHFLKGHSVEVFVFCLLLLNIWGHITTMPACSSGTLTNVLPHSNAMLQTQGTTPHPVIVYRHGADLLLCYPLMWNVTLEYTATHFNLLGKTLPGNPSPNFHTH